jgi:hypothetical protein
MSDLEEVAPVLLADLGDDDDEFCHYYCCDPNIALCGSNLDDADDAEEGDVIDCPMCTVIQERRSACAPGCQR